MKYKAISTVLSLNISNEEKAYQLFLLSLKPAMKRVFLCIPKGAEKAVTARQLGEKTGIETKSICSHIKGLQKKIVINESGIQRRKTYYL